MGHCLKLTALLAISGMMMSSASADDSDSEKAKLQGTWKATSVINDGKKVNAIKACREYTHLGLKEAKAIVDRMVDER